MSSTLQDPNVSSAASTASEDTDAVLEKMLLEAERLAAQMRSVSSETTKTESTTTAATAPIAVVSPDQHTDTTKTKKDSSSSQHAASSSSTTEEKKTDDAPDHHHVSAAVDTARQMALALEALEAITSPDTATSPSFINDSNRSNSPVPVSPMAVQKKIAAFAQTLEEPVTPNSHTSKVQWERVESAQKGDDDYVALMDYSNLSPKKVYDSPPISPISSRRLSYQIKTKQQKKRRLRLWARSVALLVLVVAIVAVWPKIVSLMKQQTESSIEQVRTEELMLTEQEVEFHLAMGCGSSPSNTIHSDMYQDHALRSVHVLCETTSHHDEEPEPSQDEDQECAALDADAIERILSEKTRTSVQDVVVQREQQDDKTLSSPLCHVPFAWILSSTCRRSASASRQRFEDLVQAMMQ